MSTYTDFNNIIKEPIMIGAKPDDRISLQKVKLFNKQNEYWGTFTGEISGNCKLDKCTATSAIITDSILSSSKDLSASTEQVIQSVSAMTTLNEKLSSFEDKIVVNCQVDVTNNVSSINFKNNGDAVMYTNNISTDNISVLNNVYMKSTSSKWYKVMLDDRNPSQIKFEFEQV